MNTTMEHRQQSLKKFTELLTSVNYNLNSLRESHDLYTCKHKTKPLIILNYGKVLTNKENTVLNACRGLVIRNNYKDGHIKVVSRGFDRFVPKNNNNSNKINIKRVTIKEDGSLIFLYNYTQSNNNTWMLSTMHNFADDTLPFSNATYEQLFMNIIDCDLNTFGDYLMKTLLNISKEFQDVKTFCFEMCSIQNRVIKKYTTPTLFLITIFGGEDGSKEFTPPRNIFEDNIYKNVKLVVEVDTPKTVTLKKISDMVRTHTQVNEPLCFEGFVIQTTDNERIKVKNKYYLIQHKLKYRGWIHFTPDIIVPLIFDEIDYDIVHNTAECLGFNNHSFVEMVIRLDHYKEVIATEYNNIINVLIKMSNHIDLEPKEYMKILGKEHTDVFIKWKQLLMYMHDMNNCQVVLKIVWRKFFLKNIKNIFTQKYDPFINYTHDIKNCRLSTMLVENNNGLSDTPGKCYCGNSMCTVRLRYDIHRYKTCHCGVNYGVVTYKSGTFLMICSNDTCQCTHQVDQTTLTPLGIPSSVYCKTLRLFIHDLITLKMNSNKISRDECYEIISKIVNRSRDLTHMALMGIDDCEKIILNF